MFDIMDFIFYLLDCTWFLLLLIAVGFVLLVKGADWLVDGAASLAKKYNVSDLVIGLTIVAFGTSMPEFVVNMASIANHSTDLAITNILGSNIINTFVILGITALVYPITSQKRSRDFDIPLSIMAGILVFAGIVIQLPNEETRSLGRLSGIVMLSLFIYFIFNTFRHAKDNPNDAVSEGFKEMKGWKAILFVLIGFLCLVIGGEMIVKSAVKVAIKWGVSDAIIGLTIVALGTSLPELATSVIAAIKKNSDIALGNVIGSNIFNVFFILGTSATIRPLPAYKGVEIDAFMVTIGSMLVWLFVKTNKQRQLKRWGGAILLILYIAYLTYRLLNC